MTEAEQLRTYKELLLHWNAKVNLIGPEAQQNLDEHIAEALEAADLLKPAGEALDFGSGGGLPAIPMAIRAREARFQLVEGDQKKWAFLKFAIRECGLNSLAHGDRLQRFVPKLAAETRFSLVTSRAVGKPGEWLGLLRNHLESDARIALFQGTPEAEAVDGFELERVEKLARGTSNYLVIMRPCFPRGT